MIFNRYSFSLLILISFLISYVKADVNILEPAKGSTFNVSGSSVSVEVQWDDSGENLDLSSEVLSYTFTLLTGTNLDMTKVTVLSSKVAPDSITNYTMSFDIDADVGASGSYFIQIYAQAKNGYTLHYTNRFTLSGMTGSEAPSGAGNAPMPEVSIVINASASMTVPYTLQTGKTRYAPMQLQPGSTVTATTWSRRFPTSSVSYYKSLAGTPICHSTVTPGWSYTLSSFINMATPAPFPTELGWYPASQRLVSASIDGNQRRIKKRRWDD
ncbi:hypothetical protein BVG19_g4063 [[Candida] boidinii]|nr:hypothetical protein BVG19_g4063 [[Candida] boidinii]OWB52950.1 hypothetical protein B5S27_g4535 [[Candida] boidinii]